MVDMLDVGLAWLAEQRKLYLTQTVIYKRRMDSVSILATIGRSTFSMPDADGIEIKVQTRDYLITSDDLIIAAKLTTPEAGDRIEEATGNIYEVVSPGADIQLWEYSDPYHRTMRIHTKQVVNP